MSKILNIYGAFSEAEASDGEHNLKFNKSLGLDGSTPEFYQTFGAELIYPYLKMNTESLSHGILPGSMGQAVVAYFLKKSYNIYLIKIIESILLKWKLIKLPLFDIVSVINTLAIPLINLNLSTLHTPF